MSQIKAYTIGFTKKSAEEFFTKLHEAGVQRIVDVRLNNVSQLAGFAKRDDLRYFLKAIYNIDYLHVPELAPTKEMLDAYKKDHRDWDRYEMEFLELIDQRRIHDSVGKAVIHGGCLLCSEHLPEHCHRRLVAEYLDEHWGDLEIVHIT